MITVALKLLFAYTRWGKLSNDQISIIKTTDFKQLFSSPLIQSKVSPKHQSLEQYTLVLRTKAPQ